MHSLIPGLPEGHDERPIDSSHSSLHTYPIQSLPLVHSRSPTSAAYRSSAVLPEPGHLSEARRKGRRKLWDIPHKYHCPIIGTCLTVEELRRIADRTANRPDKTLSEFDIHVSFVAAATDRNAISCATYKALEKKYAGSIRRYAQARDAEALIALWGDSLASGDAPGGLWALMTHPYADQPVLTRAYEEIHMLSHQIGAGQRADLKRLAETRSQLEQLQGDFDSLYRRTRMQADVREARIRELETALARQERECVELRSSERSLREQLAARSIADLQEEKALLARQVETFGIELARLRNENEALERARAEAQKDADAAEQARSTAVAECRATERLLAQRLSDQCDGCESQDCARRSNLDGRLVLCVGGRKQLVDQYRVMVSGCNGRFDHHDGGLEDSRQRLEAMLASADIVICATDYVSHGAYYRTKRFCKRHEKPHVLLGNSGVSAFALAIENLMN
jgi:hypothetical protein